MTWALHILLTYDFWDALTIIAREFLWSFVLPLLLVFAVLSVPALWEHFWARRARLRSRH